MEVDRAAISIGGGAGGLKAASIEGELYVFFRMCSPIRVGGEVLG